MRPEYRKVIKPGELVTVDNVVYRCEHTNTRFVNEICNRCDLVTKNCMELPFSCSQYSNFKRVATKNLPKTRRCKRLQNDSL